MRKKIFLCVLMVLLCALNTFAKSLVIKNPGDVKVFHKNGDEFSSPTRPNVFGIVPDTTIIEGDAILTDQKALTFKLDSSSITLEPNSLMSFYKLNDTQNILYLLRGRVDIANNPSRGDYKEYVVLTPTSRFSMTSQFKSRIASNDNSEAIYMEKGETLAFNYVTEENVVVKEGGYVDFLEGLSDNLILGDMYAKTKSLPDVNLDTAVPSKTSGSSIPENADISKGYKPDTGIAGYYDQSSSPTDYISSSYDLEHPSIVQAGVEKFIIDNSKLSDSSKEGDSSDLDETDTEVTSGNTLANKQKSSNKQEYDYISQAGRDKSSEDYDYSNADTPETSDDNEKAKIIKDESGVITGVSTDGSGKVNDINVNVNVIQPESKNVSSEGGKTIINRYYNDYFYYYDKDGNLITSMEPPVGGKPVNMPAFAKPATNNDLNTLSDVLKVAPAITPAEEEEPETPFVIPDDTILLKVPNLKQNPHRLYIGAEAGVKSAFDNENVTDNSTSPLELFARPYAKVYHKDKGLLFELKLNLDIRYSFDETANKYNFTFPQFDLYKDETLSLIGSYTQFLEDLIIKDFLYVSRNYDIPLEYNNFTLRKHISDHNIFQSYKYSSQNAVPTYTDPISFERKLPALISFSLLDTLKFRAFTEDLGNIDRYRPDAVAGQYWSRGDNSTSFAEIILDINNFNLGFGAMHMKGSLGYDGDSNLALDNVFLVAKMYASNSSNTSKIGLTAAAPFFNILANYDSGVEKREIQKLFDNVANNFMIGFSMNKSVKNMIFDFGADFSRGQLFTGLLNKREVFDSLGSLSLYSSGIGEMYSVYPYINVDFDLGKMGLLLNVDMPVFFGSADSTDSYAKNLYTKLKSWSDLDFMYRINSGAALRFNVSNTMRVNFEYEMDDIFPNRAVALLANKSFKDYLDDWNIYNFIPAISYSISEGPVSVKIISKHQRVDSNGVLNTKYKPIVSFVSSILFGNDYLFNGRYEKQLAQYQKKISNEFRIVFNLDTKFSSLKHYNGNSYTSFKVTPRVGMRFKSLSFVGKFDIENFDIPKVLESGGSIGSWVDTFIYKLDFLGMVKIDRESGINTLRRSVLFEPSYKENLVANFKFFKFVDIYISDLTEFLDGFEADSKSTYADISLGWVDKGNKFNFYFNYLLQMNWVDSLVIENSPMSFNFSVISDELFVGFNAATTIGYDGNEIQLGLLGDIADWDALINLEFGYTKKNVFDFIIRFGAQNKNLVYNKYDHLTNVIGGTFFNDFVLKTNDGTVYDGFSQFLDVETNIHLDNNFVLNVNYDLPVSLFGSTKGLLRDRGRVKLSANYASINLYGLFEKRGILCDSTSWSFSNVSDVAFKAGVEFKSNYASFLLEAESSHFIYGPITAIPESSRREFTVNVGVSFGFY